MAAKKKDEKETPTFEDSLERLEQIVAEMEGGELPLEKAMALFEEGVSLGRRCNVELDAAEKRITILLEKSDGSVVEKDFEGEDDAPAESRPPSRKAAPRATKAPAALPLDDEDDDSIPF